MQSLGKVPSARRPPANLPSLKAETTSSPTIANNNITGSEGKFNNFKLFIIYTSKVYVVIKYPLFLHVILNLKTIFESYSTLLTSVFAKEKN